MMLLGAPFILALIILLIVLPVAKTVIAFVNRDKLSLIPVEENGVIDDLVVLFEAEDLEFKQRDYTFPEIWLMGIAPPVGILLVYAFQGEIKPFQMDYFPFVIPIILTGYISYWVSRIAREDLPEKYGSFVIWGMAIGLFFFPILGLHFFSSMTALGVAIFPFLAFALIAPIPCCFYIYSELESRNYLLKNKYHIANPLPLFVLVVFLALVGIILGFPADAILQAFTGGEDFLFSNHGSFNF